MKIYLFFRLFFFHVFFFFVKRKDLTKKINFVLQLKKIADNDKLYELCGLDEMNFILDSIFYCCFLKVYLGPWDSLKYRP